MNFRFSLFLFLALLNIACQGDDITTSEENADDIIEFGPAQPVAVIGYDGQLMEPFISRDGSILFFNNRHGDNGSADLHWATKISSLEFDYQGKVSGANTEGFEGAATLDSDNNLYFVSTHDYENTLRSVYSGQFQDGTITAKQAVEDISLNQPGWVNFDVEVSADGTNLYLADGLYDANGGPYEADLFIATKTGDTFTRVTDSELILQHVNTDFLEYAACISSDELELFFTRLKSVFDPNPVSQILVSRRNSTGESFGEPQLIAELDGFVEGATLTPDNMGFYYHKKVNDNFELYFRARL